MVGGESKASFGRLGCTPFTVEGSLDCLASTSRGAVRGLQKPVCALWVLTWCWEELVQGLNQSGSCGACTVLSVHILFLTHMLQSCMLLGAHMSVSKGMR